jgi:hypothetical protein
MAGIPRILRSAAAGLPESTFTILQRILPADDIHKIAVSTPQMPAACALKRKGAEAG